MFYLSKKQHTNIVYIFLLLFSISLIIVQHINGNFMFKINNAIFHINKTANNNDLHISNAILKEQNNILKNQIREIEEQKQIYVKMNKKYNVISFLNIKYISRNQNGHFIITNANKALNIYDLVVDDNENVIGRIVDFNFDKTSAKIQLISDKNFFIPIKSSKTNSYGIISYTLKCKNNIFFDKANGELEDNEIITTSGEENLIPQGFLIGRIHKQNNKFCITPSTDVKHVKTLIVVRPKTYNQLVKEIEQKEEK